MTTIAIDDGYSSTSNEIGTTDNINWRAKLEYYEGSREFEFTISGTYVRTGKHFKRLKLPGEKTRFLSLEEAKEKMDYWFSRFGIDASMFIEQVKAYEEKVPGVKPS